MSYAVGTLAKYTKNPAELHWHALLRVLGYLAKPVDYCIRYEGIYNGKSGVKAIGYSKGILLQLSEFNAMWMQALQQIWTPDEVQDSGRFSVMEKLHADISSIIEYGVGVHSSQCSSTRSYIA
jgi:hypothetical protein